MKNELCYGDNLDVLRCRAIRDKSMSMDDVAQKLDELLRTSDYAVFPGFHDFLKGRAMEHVATAWKRFQKMLSDGTHMSAISR